MKGHTIIIKVDGTLEEKDWDHMPPLDYYRQAVGGHIDTVPYWPKGVAFCHGEGKLLGFETNVAAQLIWGHQFDVLVGNIIQITGDDEFMRQL